MILNPVRALLAFRHYVIPFFVFYKPDLYRVLASGLPPRGGDVKELIP